MRRLIASLCVATIAAAFPGTAVYAQSPFAGQAIDPPICEVSTDGTPRVGEVGTVDLHVPALGDLLGFPGRSGDGAFGPRADAGSIVTFPPDGPDGPGMAFQVADQMMISGRFVPWVTFDVGGLPFAVPCRVDGRPLLPPNLCDALKYTFHFGLPEGRATYLPIVDSLGSIWDSLTFCSGFGGSTEALVGDVLCDVDFADWFAGLGVSDLTVDRANVLAGDLQVDVCDPDGLVAQGHGAMLGDFGVTVSCLGGNGRVDINLINHGADDAEYRVDLAGLSPRFRNVVTADWGRISISGRADGVHPLQIRRGAQLLLDSSVTVACGGDAQVTHAEVSIVNACRDGLGYLLFQLANGHGADRPYVIEFDTVPNRSTTADAYGAAVRAVTGRRTGLYGYEVRSGSTIVQRGEVEINC